MKFYTLLNNRKFFNYYKTHLEALKKINHLSESNYDKYNKDLLLIKKCLRHNLIVIQNESNPNIYYLMTKTTDLEGFKSPQNAFESSKLMQPIKNCQTDSIQGYSECLFLLELQNSDEINNLFVPLNEDNIKTSFGSLENAENLYNSAQEYYTLNKHKVTSWVDVTRYTSLPDEMYKQHCYINFNKNPYYPFKESLYELNENNETEKEALQLANNCKSLVAFRKPIEEL